MGKPRELKRHWQLRFYDSSRAEEGLPVETTVSVPKAIFPTRREAEAEYERLNYLYRHKGEYDPWRDAAPGLSRTGLTLEEAAEEFIAEKVRKGRRGQRGGWNERSARTMAAGIRHFAAHAGAELGAAQLRTHHLEDFIFRDGLRPASRETYRKRLHTFLRWLRKKGYNDRAEKVPAFKRRDKLPEYVTREELEEICAAHAAHWEEARAHSKVDLGYHPDVWRFVFYQGLRLGEAGALRRADVDLKRGTVQIGHEGYDPKMGRDRLIPLVDEARPIAERMMEEEPADAAQTGLLFGREHATTFSRSFKRARRKALPTRDRLNFHRLRNSCAVYWLREGKRLLWVRDLLGHASVEMLEKYARAAGRGGFF